MRFEVFGKVIGKARARTTRYGTYTPPETKAKEQEIAWLYKAAGGKMLSGALKINITTYRKLPKSKPKYIEQELDVFKPDADNVSKLVLDALNGVAYKDDACVVDLHVVKMPRTRREREYMVVEVERFT